MNKLPESSTYPKTSGKMKDVILEISQLQDPPKETNFPYVGTVKLHGAHNDIVFSVDGEVRYQSRNCYLTVESDSYGFAKFCDARKIALDGIRKAIQRRWGELHPGTPKNEESNTTVAGEWIGTGIQKNVAISQLSKRFVICAIKINEDWQHIAEYHSVKDEGSLIFNIARGGVYHLFLSLEDDGKAFMEEAEKLTMEVVASCPFARTMDAEGAGEGIVWTPARTSALPNQSEFWLKTKSDNFRAPLVRPQTGPQSVASVERSARAKQFAEMVYTEARMEQAWDYLRETGLEQSRKNIGTFITWLCKDIEAEEKTEIKELNVSVAWKVEGARIAKEWFAARP